MIQKLYVTILLLPYTRINKRKVTVIHLSSFHSNMVKMDYTATYFWISRPQRFVHHPNFNILKQATNPTFSITILINLRIYLQQNYLQV